MNPASYGGMDQLRTPPARVGISMRRSLSDTFITLPGGVSLMISVYNDMPIRQRKVLLRRVFRSLKPALREIRGMHPEGPQRRLLESFDPQTDSRSAFRSLTLPKELAQPKVLKCSSLELLRAERGWTQAMLALSSGVSRFQISRIESGKTTASAQTWLKLHRALSLDNHGGLEDPGASEGASLRNF